MPRTLEVRVEADTRRLDANMDRAADSVLDAGRSFDRAGRQANRLGVQIDRAGDRAARSISTFNRLGAAVVGAFSLAAIAGATRALSRLIEEAAQAGDAVINLSRAASLTTEEFQGFSRVFEFGGASQEQFAAGISRLSLALSDAARGSKAAQDALAELGITSSNTGEALRQAIQTVTPDNFNELRRAIRLAFGDDAARQFASTLQLSAEEVEGLISQMNILTDQQNQSLADLNRELTNARREIETAFRGSIADNAEDIAEAVDDLADSFIRLAPALSVAIELTIRYLDIWLNTPVVRILGFVLDRIGALSDSTANLEGVSNQAVVSLENLSTSAERVSASLGRLSVVGEEPFLPLIDSTRNLFNQLQNLNALLDDSDSFDEFVGNITRISGEIDDLRTRLIDALSEIGLSVEEVNNILSTLNLDIIPEDEVERVNIQVDALSRTIASGFAQAVTAADSFTDALVNIVQQIAATIVEALALSAILQAIGATGDLGFGDTFAALLGFGGGRQFGGRVAPGRAYVVGERRPELFIPDSAGSIRPSIDAGPNVEVTLNVTGIDSGDYERLATRVAPHIIAAVRVGLMTPRGSLRLAADGERV